MAIPNPLEMTGNARRSRRKRIKAKMKRGDPVSAEEKAWLQLSYDTQIKPGPKRLAPPTPPMADTGQPEPESTDTDPLQPAPAPDPAEAEQGATDYPTWEPPIDAIDVEFTEMKSEARESNQDETTKVPDGSRQSDADPQQSGAAPKPDESAEAQYAMFGAGISTWVLWSVGECARLGSPLPAPAMEGLDPTKFYQGIAKYCGESATRVARKYGLTFAWQDELVTAAAIAIPAVVLRAAYADKKSEGEDEKENIKKAAKAEADATDSQPTESGSESPADGDLW